MFFESAKKGKNSWWRYMVLFLAAFAASNTIGAIPLIIIIAVKTVHDPAVLGNASDNISDLSVFGIDPLVGLILLIFPFIIGLATVVVLFKPLHNRSFKSVINGSRDTRWPRIFTGFIVWVVLMFIYLFLNLRLDPGNFVINNTGRSLIYLVIISFLLMPFQTTFEEVLFRGYLMQGLGVSASGKWMPLIVTSVLFGLMHGLNPEIKEFGFFTMMPQYITFGLLFGIITILDDGIELAIGAHAANNIFLSVFVTQRSSTLQTPALYEQQTVYPWADFSYMLLFSLAFIFVLSLIYKWRLKGSFEIAR